LLLLLAVMEARHTLKKVRLCVCVNVEESSAANDDEVNDLLTDLISQLRHE